MRTKLAILAVGASLSLGGCAYGGLSVGSGYGYNGYGYDDYGYGGGYGSPWENGYDPYRYGGYGYNRYGYSPYGWYGNYYYPGTGYYVYDRYRQRRQMTAAEREFWRQRLSQWLARNRNGSTNQPVVAPAQENWSGFDRPQTRSGTTTRRVVTPGASPERRTEVVQQRREELRRQIEERRERVSDRRTDATQRREEVRQRVQRKLEDRRQPPTE
ncbi:hypothetical protein [Sphingomonas sinipercae]|uniref:hypothetical protein n=1 Tax=Sphingomonas sinipercae TaxID=2714944 RepID=UPI0019D223DC|nr:hypothetical protein [Sphingomonas sinipercae]